MANNLKKFTTEAEYSAATLNYPAVSWVTATDNVYFDKTNPVVPMLRNIYLVTDTSNPVELFHSGSGSGSGEGSGGGLAPVKMWIDGVEVTPADNYNYTFDTTGEHVVEFELDDGVTEIGDNAFSNIHNIRNVELGSGITSIGMSAFEGCSGLTSIEIPNSVTSIGDGAFANCRGLTSIDIPNSVTSIGNNTFYFCTSLTSVTIPNSVTYIGAGSFNGCSSLTSITINATTPPTLEMWAFQNTNNCPIYVPSASVSAYQAASGWSDYASRIQAIA